MRQVWTMIRVPRMVGRRFASDLPTLQANLFQEGKTRTVYVTGEAAVNVIPNRVTLFVRALGKGKTKMESKDTLDWMTSKSLAAVREQGVTDTHLQTGTIVSRSIKGEGLFKGEMFHSAQDIFVTLSGERDKLAAQYDTILSKLTDLGVEFPDPPQLSCSDLVRLRNITRRDAYRNAEVKAQSYFIASLPPQESSAPTTHVRPSSPPSPPVSSSATPSSSQISSGGHSPHASQQTHSNQQRSASASVGSSFSPKFQVKPIFVQEGTNTVESSRPSVSSWMFGYVPKARSPYLQSTRDEFSPVFQDEVTEKKHLLGTIKITSSVNVLFELPDTGFETQTHS